MAGVKDVDFALAANTLLTTPSDAGIDRTARPLDQDLQVKHGTLPGCIPLAPNLRIEPA
ncbi:hypothetical protein FRC08_018431 [Ceratobasidium sp. 394]|nr:hypothetical protein FRC08_018431 [Ceratobasidium sp. 394]